MRQTLANWYKYEPKYPYSLSEPDTFIRYGNSKETLKLCAIKMSRQVGGGWYALRIEGYDGILYTYGNTLVYRQTPTI